MSIYGRGGGSNSVPHNPKRREVQLKQRHHQRRQCWTKAWNCDSKLGISMPTSATNTFTKIGEIKLAVLNSIFWNPSKFTINDADDVNIVNIQKWKPDTPKKVNHFLELSIFLLIWNYFFWLKGYSQIVAMLFFFFSF